MINRDSPDWAEVEAWAQSELTRCRARNDDARLTERDTAALRGEIARLKKLLALPDHRAIDYCVQPEPPYES